ncbi:ABC transporter substrate-binding protein, partial [Escherichia coli]|nr:ABC transporter substrate-binding protein [Escherichia coli]
AKYGESVSTFGGYAHDAFVLMTDAIARAGTDDPAEIRNALEATEGLVGTTGTYTFSAQDHLGLDLSAFRMRAITNGGWSAVE